MLKWRRASTPGNVMQTSQKTTLLSALPPLTPWQTSWLFTGPQVTDSSSSHRWVFPPLWGTPICPQLQVSKTGPRVQLTGSYQARRRGTFHLVWQGCAVTRAAPRMILDACAEAGSRVGGWWHKLDHGAIMMSSNGQCTENVWCWLSCSHSCCSVQEKHSPSFTSSSFSSLLCLIHLYVLYVVIFVNKF